MGGWLTMQTLIAFILGVLLSAMVKGLVSQVKGKVSGA
jgi:hypothetical protein